MKIELQIHWRQQKTAIQSLPLLLHRCKIQTHANTAIYNYLLQLPSLKTKQRCHYAQQI